MPGGQELSDRRGKPWAAVGRRRLLLCILVLSLWWAPAAALAAPGTRAPSVHLTAERVRSTAERIVASGNVSVELEGGRLECQQLEMDRRTGRIRASGECVFYWGEDNFIASDAVTYDPDTRTALMTRAAGLGRDLSAAGLSSETGLFFWADRLRWTPRKMELENAVVTTCDAPADAWHYHLRSERIEIFPGDRLVASNTSFAFHGTPLYTLPTLTFSLKPDTRPRQPGFLPTVGSNHVDGPFVRNSFDYSLDQGNYGSVLLDYSSKTGLGRGLEHHYTLGKGGAGSLYAYQVGGRDSPGDRFEVRHNLTYQLDEHTTLVWGYGASRLELPGLVSPLNINSNVGLSRTTENEALAFSHTYHQSGPNRNTTWRLFYDLQLPDGLSTTWSGELATATTPVARTRRLHYRGNLRHSGPLFVTQLELENTSGSRAFFLNRTPELSLRSRALHLGPVPLVAAASFGHLTEGPSLRSATRSDLSLRIPEQMVHWGSGRLQLGAGFRQLFYGSGEAQYVLAARAGWLQNVGELGVVRLDYNWQESQGFTPFQHDLHVGYQNVTGGVQIGQEDRWGLSLTAGYDLGFDTFQELIPRVELRPGESFRLSAAARYDPNHSLWRNLDSTVEIELTPGLSLKHWGLYDLVNSRLTYQDYMLSLEEHDWIASLVYRGVQREIFFQFSLKGFPVSPVSIGPNPRDPILPQNLSNAFVR